MDAKLFSIGDMARLFHLSVSSIRHYESVGLITPEYVDPATGYRYYSPRQFELFNTVRYLRALDMPLGEIADFLHGREVDRIEEKLCRQKAVVAEKQRELARIERKIDAQLRRLRDAQSAALGSIEIVRVPPCRIFWTEDHTTAQDPAGLDLSVSNLAAAQAEATIFLGKVGFSISEEHLREKQYDRYDGTFLLLDEADRFDGAFLSLPETLCVRVRFRGHHLQSPEQYRRLERFMAEHRLKLSGFSREVVLIDYDITSDTEKFVTEICIPVIGTGHTACGDKADGSV